MDYTIAAGLLTIARSRGITIRLILEERSIEWHGPADAMPDALLSALQAETENLVRLLKWEADKLGDQTSIDDVLKQAVSSDNLF